MQGKSYSTAKAYLVFFLTTGLFFSGTVWSAEQANSAPEPEPELVIAKYGSLSVKSSLSGAKVYIDEIYKGNTDSIIESIIAGEHVIVCKADSQSVSGTFHVRKNETLRLEALFEEGKLVLFREQVKAEVEKKKPEPAAVLAKPKKTVVEPKKAEQKNPAEERRRAHLNVMNLDFEITDKQAAQVEHKFNQQVISKYSVKKNTIGKYYRTKQGVLLCDTGPCELTWSVSFIYTDETSKADALLLKWKETVFNGITPAGTSKRELESCLNGQCWRMQDASTTDTMQESMVGRYRLSWTKASVLLRRSDIMQEILDAGRSLSDY